eukprot:GHVU01090431.1.p1 GENE.GHVU01090431.1~~GHVU01090431.1.p1  ORF type:complete len:115 (+),score=5.50 GHVU01090431.1:43-345(+)
MAEGSPSQASTLGGQAGGSSQQLNAAGTAGGQRTIVRRRPGTTPTQNRQPRPQSTDSFKFYTEDSPGLKLGPTTVLVLSLVFMLVVVLLHILGKIQGRAK